MDNRIYEVCRIDSMNEFWKAQVFKIDQYRWSSGYRPEAYGRMALLNNYGLVVSMTSVEKDPLCVYKHNDDPVYMDSAMEAFFNFARDREKGPYMNFEMNSYGAMLSGFGIPGNRKPIRELTSFRAVCEAVKDKDSWSVLLKIPKELITALYQESSYQPEDGFTCNFYKISEDKSIEHYASYSPIDNPVPNFHLPVFFAQAVVK